MRPTRSKRPLSPKQERDASVVRGLKPLSSTQLNISPSLRANAAVSDAAVAVKASRGHQSNVQAVKQLCDAIDDIVKSRSAVIRTQTAAQYSSFRAQFSLQLSKFSLEEQNMPLEEFLKTCPSIKSVITADGTVQLLKRSSPYPKLEDSKKNLQDLLTKARDGTSKGTNSSLFTPCTGPKLPGAQSYTSEQEQQEPDTTVVGEDLDWIEYHKHLQSLRCSSTLTPSLERNNKYYTPMIFKGGLGPGVTPKTLRLPKHGETMLSINGSPLGQFGKTPGSVDCGRTTRTMTRLANSKRTLKSMRAI